MKTIQFLYDATTSTLIIWVGNVLEFKNDVKCPDVNFLAYALCSSSNYLDLTTGIVQSGWYWLC